MTHSQAEIANETKLDLAVDLLRSSGRVHLRALGASMIPALWPGDQLAIEAASATSLFPGEIVLIHRDGRFFIHRLIKRGSRSGPADWVTQGDSLPNPDPPVAACGIIGRVYGIVRQNEMTVPRRNPSWGAQIFSRILRCSNLLRDLALRCHLIRQKLSILNPALSPRRDLHFPAAANPSGE